MGSAAPTPSPAPGRVFPGRCRFWSVMRYFIAIACILLSVSLFTAYRLFLRQEAPAGAVALEINGRRIFQDEYLRLLDEAKKKSTGGEGFNEALITRELLIQEAQRQRLDQEETFRRSIQNFYEQSLIRLLTDRKMREMKAGVTDAEIAAYERLLPAALDLVRLSAVSAEAAAAGNFTGEERLTLPFADLAETVQLALLDLSPGMTSKPLADGKAFTVYRFEAMAPETGAAVPLPPREEIRARLEKARLGAAMDQWLQELRRSARVAVHPAAEGTP